MELTKKDKTIKYVIYCLIILFAGILQNVSGLWFTSGNARCFFLIPVCVLLGINEDEKNAALLGFFGGLIWDAVSSSHMGFNCIFLMLACYISSAFVVFVFRNTFLLGLIEAVVTIAVYVFVYWILFVLINQARERELLSESFIFPVCFIQWL